MADRHEIKEVIELRTVVNRQDGKIKALNAKVERLERELQEIRQQMGKRPADRSFHGGKWSPPSDI